MLPSFTGPSNGFLDKLETVPDSIKLGQYMLYTGTIVKVRSHPNIVNPPGSYEEKHPLFFDNDAPIFTYNGYYYKPRKQDTEGQKKYLIITCVILFALIFYDHWPTPLKIATWYGFVSAVIAYFVTIGVRILTSIVMFHFGFNFKLFPNYFNSFVNPWKMLLPVC